MKKTLFVLSAFLMFSFFANPISAQKNKSLKTFQDSMSYAYGFLIGQQMKEMGTVDKEILKKGLDDQFAGKPIITEQEAQVIMKKAQQERQRAEKKKKENEGKVNKEKGAKFLAANKQKKDVGVTPSGLQYKVLKTGKGGRKPRANHKVKVHYEGKLIDGTIFDSSYERGEPTTFGLNQVIKGWTEGLQLMSVGDKYRLYIPSELAYGKRGQRGIPSNAVLVFDVELLDIITTK